MKINIGKLIDNALQKCGVFTSSETPENILRAKESIYFVLLDMFNRGVPIFAVVPKLIGFEPAKWIYELSDKVMDVQNLNWRQYHHALAAPTGGTSPQNLEDYNWDTFAVTTTTFTLTISPGPIFIDYYGIAPFGDQIISCVIEVQIDETTDTWFTVKTYIDEPLTDGVWLWVDLITPKKGAAVRLRVTNATQPVTLRGFFTGNRQSAYEQICAKMNRDDFFALPTRGIQGTPINYYFLKDTNPQLQLWQYADGANVFNWALNLYVLEVPEIDLSLPLFLPIPDWYYEAIEWGVAAKMMYMLPGVTPERMTMITSEASRMMSQAEASNSDSAPFNMLGNTLSAYQRRR